MTALSPSRVTRGTGQLHREQMVTPKLLASGMSYLETSSSPDFQLNCAKGTAMFVERNPPVALRQREQ